MLLGGDSRPTNAQGNVETHKGKHETQIFNRHMQKVAQHSGEEDEETQGVGLQPCFRSHQERYPVRTRSIF